MRLIALWFALVSLGFLVAAVIAITKARWGRVVMFFIGAVLIGGAAAAINAAA